MIEKSQEGEAEPVQLLNPGHAAIAKLRDLYRQVIYIKHRDADRLEELKSRLEPVLEKHPLFAGVQIQFDFDPVGIY